MNIGIATRIEPGKMTICFTLPSGIVEQYAQSGWYHSPLTVVDSSTLEYSISDCTEDCCFKETKERLYKESFFLLHHLLVTFPG